MKKVIVEQEIINNIIDDYINHNLGQDKLAQKYKLTRGVIKRILTENNVEIRSRTSTYTYNQEIFEKITTPEQAYWLGFLAADGCNYQRENNASVILSIHQQDLKHLEKFKEFCQTNANIQLFEQN